MLTSVFVPLDGIVFIRPNGLMIRSKVIQEPYDVKYFLEMKRLKDLQSEGVFRIQASICDGAFLWIYLTAYYFYNTSSIIDVWVGYIKASENNEIFKVKLRWSKSSRLLQRIAFLVFLFVLHPFWIKYGITISNRYVIYMGGVMPFVTKRYIRLDRIVDGNVDIFCIAETKLDKSFPNNQSSF